MDEKRLALYRSTLHPLLSVLIPFLFLWSMVPGLRLAFLDPLAIGPPRGFEALLLAFGIGEALSANALARRGIRGFFPRLREIILFLIGGALLLFVLQGDFSRSIGALVVPLIFPLVLMLIQWLLSLYIHRTLIEREAFLALLVGKSGSSLKNAVRDAFEESGNSEKGIRKIRRTLVSFMVIVSLVALIEFSVVMPGVSWLIPCVSLEILGIVFLTVLNEFLAEQARLGEGLSVTRALRVGWARTAILSLLFVSLLSLLLAGRQSLLPASSLGALLQRVSQFFSLRINVDMSKLKRPETQTQESELNLNLQERGQALAALGQQAPFAKIARIIGFVLLAAFGLILVYFLIRPLLSRETREAFRSFHPVMYLKSRALKLLGMLRKAYRAFLVWLRSPSKGMSRAVRTLVEGLRDTVARGRETRAERGAEADRERKRKLSRIIREFVRLIHWGERGGVRFHKAIGPFEFAELLARATPERRSALESVASAFEELVYSPHAIEQKRIAEYFRGIESIVRLRPVRSEK